MMLEMKYASNNTPCDMAWLMGCERRAVVEETFVDDSFALFCSDHMTPKTVVGHLVRSYMKLSRHLEPGVERSPRRERTFSAEETTWGCEVGDCVDRAVWAFGARGVRVDVMVCAAHTSFGRDSFGRAVDSYVWELSDGFDVVTVSNTVLGVASDA